MATTSLPDSDSTISSLSTGSYAAQMMLLPRKALKNSTTCLIIAYNPCMAAKQQRLNPWFPPCQKKEHYIGPSLFRSKDTLCSDSGPAERALLQLSGLPNSAKLRFACRSHKKYPMMSLKGEKQMGSINAKRYVMDAQTQVESQTLHT